jgi:hypothetical protein
MTTKKELCFKADVVCLFVCLFQANTISLDDDFCLDVPLAYSKTRQLSPSCLVCCCCSPFVLCFRKVLRHAGPQGELVAAGLQQRVHSRVSPVLGRHQGRAHHASRAARRGERKGLFDVERIVLNVWLQKELFTYYDYKDEPRPPLWFV